MVLCYYPQQPFHHSYSTEITTPPHSPLFEVDSQEPIWTCCHRLSPDTSNTTDMRDMPNPLLAPSLDRVNSSMQPQNQSHPQSHSRQSRSISFDIGRLLQLQTQAAVPKVARPQAQPVQVQNGLDSHADRYRRASADTPSIYTSSSSGSSPDTSQQDCPQTPSSATDSSRCSRCKRSRSIDSESETSAAAMVQYGLNLFYCSRCARTVGLTPQ